MKLRSLIVAVFLLVVVMSLGSIQTGASSELIVNGGFENGNPSGWTVLGSVFTARFSHSGTFSLRLGVGRLTGQVSQSFNVPTGVSPTLTFSYLGVPGDDDRGKLVVTLLDQNGAIITQWNGIIDYRWHQVTYGIDPKYAGSTLTLRFFGSPDLAHEIVELYCRPPPRPCRHRVLTYAVYVYIDDVSVSY